ncbi:MAG TPA: hypothetical protein VGO47_04600 [Chlamydiales bacterium]|nr:hypothetical protein [Chlamydiales bacterium]
MSILRSTSKSSKISLLVDEIMGPSRIGTNIVGISKFSSLLPPSDRQVQVRELKTTI